jgi:SPP1 family predicted phage head-tail adaptor
MTMNGAWHAVQLQHYTETRSASGQTTRTYATYATVWLKLRTLSGNERIQAQQASAVLTHEAIMVYCASIVPHADHRIVWGARTFDIKDVRNVDERNEELRMLCSEVLATGPASSPSPSGSVSASPSVSSSV